LYNDVTHHENELRAEAGENFVNDVKISIQNGQKQALYYSALHDLEKHFSTAKLGLKRTSEWLAATEKKQLQNADELVQSFCEVTSETATEAEEEDTARDQKANDSDEEAEKLVEEVTNTTESGATMTAARILNYWNKCKESTAQILKYPTFIEGDEEVKQFIQQFHDIELRADIALKHGGIRKLIESTGKRYMSRLVSCLERKRLAAIENSSERLRKVVDQLQQYKDSVQTGVDGNASDLELVNAFLKQAEVLLNKAEVERKILVRQNTKMKQAIRKNVTDFIQDVQQTTADVQKDTANRLTKEKQKIDTDITRAKYVKKQK